MAAHPRRREQNIRAHPPAGGDIKAKMLTSIGQHFLLFIRTGEGVQSPSPANRVLLGCVLTKPHQYRGYLRAGGIALRLKRTFTCTVHNTGAAGPLHSRDSIFAQV